MTTYFSDFYDQITTIEPVAKKEGSMPDHSNNERPEYLLLQCVAERDIDKIQNYLNVYSVFISTIEYYAWYHGASTIWKLST